MISGGRPVAKALKAEGIDSIFTLCGGHIIQPALGAPREAIARTGSSAVVNISVDPDAYAPGAENRTMYK